MFNIQSKYIPFSKNCVVHLLCTMCIDRVAVPPRAANSRAVWVGSEFGIDPAMKKIGKPE